MRLTPTCSLPTHRSFARRHQYLAARGQQEVYPGAELDKAKLLALLHTHLLPDVAHTATGHHASYLPQQHLLPALGLNHQESPEPGNLPYVFSSNSQSAVRSVSKPFCNSATFPKVAAFHNPSSNWQSTRLLRML